MYVSMEERKWKRGYLSSVMIGICVLLSGAVVDSLHYSGKDYSGKASPARIGQSDTRKLALQQSHNVVFMPCI